jgi:hypothetical protein
MNKDERSVVHNHIAHIAGPRLTVRLTPLPLTLTYTVRIVLYAVRHDYHWRMGTVTPAHRRVTHLRSSERTYVPHFQPYRLHHALHTHNGGSACDMVGRNAQQRTSHHPKAPGRQVEVVDTNRPDVALKLILPHAPIRSPWNFSHLRTIALSL